MDLIDGLCAFCNDDALPAAAQAAITHEQFETVHPFVDGNGRTGRALIYMVLRRRGLVQPTPPPISLSLATQAKTYVDSLAGTRVVGPPAAALPGSTDGSPSLPPHVNGQLPMRNRSSRKLRRCKPIGLRVSARFRPDASARRLLRFLPAMPILTVEEAASALQRRFCAANQPTQRLVEAEILIPTSNFRRNRRFEVREVSDAFTAFERQLASPDGDTRISKPVRAVPARPRPPVSNRKRSP